MTRKTRAPALVLFALVAMSMMAAAAQGAQLHVNALSNAVLTGEQLVKHKFQITTAAAGPNVQCTLAHFEGTVSDELPQITASEVSITGRYTGCSFFGLAATVSMNGCKYTFTGGQPEPLTALVDIAGCTAAKPRIEVSIPGCTLTVPEQNGLSHIVLASKAGPPEDVEAQATVTGIKYETHGAACAHQPETTPRTDASYTGTVTLKAFEDKGSEQATHNGHQYAKLLAGEQRGLRAEGGELHV